MANVTIRPLPQVYRTVSKRLRPYHPPIFDGEPTPADISLARALFQELDEESQDWYGRRGIFEGL